MFLSDDTFRNYVMPIALTMTSIPPLLIVALHFGGQPGLFARDSSSSREGKRQSQGVRNDQGPTVDLQPSDARLFALRLILIALRLFALAATQACCE